MHSTNLLLVRQMATGEQNSNRSSRLAKWSSTRNFKNLSCPMSNWQSWWKWLYGPWLTYLLWASSIVPRAARSPSFIGGVMVVLLLLLLFSLCLLLRRLYHCKAHETSTGLLFSWLSFFSPMCGSPGSDNVSSDYCHASSLCMFVVWAWSKKLYA